MFSADGELYVDMKIFIKDFTCLSKVHCETCRDKTEVGNAFRKSLSRAFVLPADAPDFECPYDKPWGWKRPSRGLGDTIEKVAKAIGIKPCGGGCGKRKKKLNKLFPYKGVDA